MSAENEDEIAQEIVAQVAEFAVEPSYISEIARKLQNLYRDWEELAETTAVARVARAAYLLGQNDTFEVYEVAADEEGQVEASPIKSIAIDQEEGDYEWLDYKIVHNEAMSTDEVRQEILDNIDPAMSLEAKAAMVRDLSGFGNEISQKAEEIMQDVMQRQFRYYERTETPTYNDPGVDFLVEDDDRRDYGIAVEISVRWVNPIGKPYVDAKKDKAFNQDMDLIIMAPRFTDTMLEQYENPDNPDWHADPFESMVHLHRVPASEPEVYKPFAKTPEEIKVEDSKDYGNPVIVEDGSDVRNRLNRLGHVGDKYPVVESDYQAFRVAADTVGRPYIVMSESRFRNGIREALEPLLPELGRPYKVEQFLIDTYWDKGLTQSGAGSLVDRAGSTIGDWMGREKWNIITRGTGAPELSGEVREIWRRMYLGEDPFPDEMSGYRIQAEYNRHPLWGLDDWREWFEETTEEQRRQSVSMQDDYRDQIDYTILLGVEDRLQPSYSFVMSTLREEGVEIRDPDRAPRVPYPAYSNSKTLEWMINRNSGTVAKDTDGSQLVMEEDVEVFDSYLEVDIATWLSENGITYAHEPFTIPSQLGPKRDAWERMVEAIQAVGMSATSRTAALRKYEDVKSEIEETGADTLMDEEIDGRNFDEFVGWVLPIWSEVYDKHRLANEAPTPEVLPSLEFFQKQWILPDLVLYPDEDSKAQPKSWDGWDTWEYIVEVSGLWGVGIPEDEEGEEWWQWYRVSGVAFKELMYKLLGLWEDESGDPRTIFLVPFQPYIEGVSDGIPEALENDDNYVIFTTTSAEYDLGELPDLVGATQRTVDSGLSPAIELVEYGRPVNEGGIEPVDWEYEGINLEAVENNADTVIIGEDMIVHYGDMGDVYITPDSVHVKESQWRRENMILLREYALNVMSELADDGIVEGLVLA